MPKYRNSYGEYAGGGDVGPRRRHEIETAVLSGDGPYGVWHPKGADAAKGWTKGGRLKIGPTDEESKAEDTDK